MVLATNKQLGLKTYIDMQALNSYLSQANDQFQMVLPVLMEAIPRIWPVL